MAQSSLDVLVVDDEGPVGDLFQKFFDKYQLQYKIVDRVKKAMSIVKKEKPRMAIVDLFLPELDGFDLAEEIFKMAPDCHIVLMSGIYDFSQQHLKNLGIEDFVKKPVDFDDLQKILKKRGIIS